MTGSVEPTRSPYDHRDGWVAAAMWTAVVLLIAPVVIGTVVLLIPGSGSLGSAPAGYFILGTVMAMVVCIAVVSQIAARRIGWSIHPVVATLLLSGAFALVAAGLEWVFTGIAFAVVATVTVVLSAAAARVGPTSARIPATILAATVAIVSVYLLVDIS